MFTYGKLGRFFHAKHSPQMRILKSLSRGMRALDYLRALGEPARLTEVARALGVEKSNASHVLKTLVASGYAEQDPLRRYRASAKVSMLAGSATSLEEVVACKTRMRPLLESMAADTGECTHLAVLVKSQVWYVDKVDSQLPLKVDHPVGLLAPLHCTALGKAFLAFAGAEPERPLVRYTQRTITSRAGLAAEIARIRTRGYAIDDEEYASGIRCVAKPVLDSNGRMTAAIGISGPASRIGEARIAELAAAIDAS